MLEKIGPYTVIAELGKGGMGEVYRARDSRLDRDVAIKVLPAAFADDPERRARFEREAKAIAALSHPNILAIFDFGQNTMPDAATGRAGSFLYVVTELLEGETLRDRLAHGPLPVRKAIDTGVQIGRGLAAAHAQGVVHRDLKPENVFLLKDGQVKILDFGLAKSAGDPTKDGVDATATAAALTDPGTVMGTVGYMAPEQVRGHATDARTDLFAFGAVLYEMLTGERAFRRETAAETMTAILREDPPELTATRADVPPALDRIVRHCLEKQPAERFQTARDVAFALETFSGSSISSSKVAVVPEPPKRRSSTWPIIGVALALVGLAGGYGLSSWLHQAPPATPITFETRTWDPQWITNMRFGPDGETIVYSAAATGNSPSLFVMRPGAQIGQPLGPPDTHLLSVSKTGEIAALTNAVFINHRLFRGTLSKVTMDGAVRPFIEGVREADFGPDGQTMAIVRTSGTSDRLEYPVDTKLHEVQKGYLSDPRVSPDGAQVAFIEHPLQYDDRGVLRVADRKGNVRTLGDEFWGGQGVAWAADSKSVFLSIASRGGDGYRPAVVNVDGPAVMRQAFPSVVSAEMMDASPNGRLLLNLSQGLISIRVLRPGDSIEREMPWLDLSLPTRLSADGSWLLFTDESQSAGLNYAVGWRKTDGSPPVKLGEGAALSLSPDEKWAIAFIPSPAPGKYVAYPTGAGQPLPLDFSPLKNVASIGFFPDGRLFFCGQESDKPSRCYRRALTGGTPEPVTPEGYVGGSVAPDGHTVILLTTTGEWQVLDLNGGPARTVPGDHSRDSSIGWTSDSRARFVAVRNTFPQQIDRLDLATGARTHVRDIMPPDRAGVISVNAAHMIRDGQGYAYFYWRQTTRAIVVSGVSAK